MASTFFSSTRRSPEVMTSTAASADLRRKMMLLAICPTWMPSASAACCAVRAASSSITGECGWPFSCNARATRCTPSGSDGDSASDMGTILFVFVLDRRRRARVRLAAQEVADELARVDQLVQVDACFDAQAVQHVDHVFGCDIACRAFRIRTSPEAGDRRVELPDAHLQARHRVGQRLPVGNKKKTRNNNKNVVLQRRFHRALNLERR